MLAALRLDWPDLFPAGGNGKAELVATYDYTDDQGRLLYQAVRYFPKDFKRRRPDGHGGWTWTLGDARLVLYRLPRVLAAVELGQPVYVVEGEKDVHAIEWVGATATTIIGGVNGRWLPAFSRLRATSRVRVVADDDPPGRRRASSLENSGSHRPLTPPMMVVAVAPTHSMAWTSFSPPRSSRSQSTPAETR